jgi:hypothetical protein
MLDQGDTTDKAFAGCFFRRHPRRKSAAPVGIDVLDVWPEKTDGFWHAEHGNCEGIGETPSGAVLALACAFAEEVADWLGAPWWAYADAAHG